jgi:hypothetical protein
VSRPAAGVPYSITSSASASSLSGTSSLATAGVIVRVGPNLFQLEASVRAVVEDDDLQGGRQANFAARDKARLGTIGANGPGSVRCWV